MTESTHAPYPPLCRALRLASIETGIAQAELARRLGEKLSRISRYYNDREPSHHMVRRIEVAMGLPSGWLWSQAGYLIAPQSFGDWLAIDPALSEDGKKMLGQMYEQLTASYRARNGGLLTTAETASAHSSRRATS